MKAIKTLMAVSVLAAAGTAHATTVATFSGSATSSMFRPAIDCPECTLTYDAIEFVTASSGTASAVLDDSGTFTITSTISIQTLLGTDTTLGLLESLTGTWDGTTFTATGGAHTLLNCVDKPSDPFSMCSIWAGVTGPTDITGSVTLSGGAVSITQTDTVSSILFSYRYSFPPSVPIPGAAWLFGSGLIGLTRATRCKIK